jgi:hypothetical protein
MPTVWHLSQRISMKIISALVSLAVHWQSGPFGGRGQSPPQIGEYRMAQTRKLIPDGRTTACLDPDPLNA